MMTAPKGNTNGLRHGRHARVNRHGIVIAGLGPKLKTVDGYAHQFRRGLEAEAKKVHGKLTIGLMATVNEAVTYEQLRHVAMRRLSESSDLPAMRAVAFFTRQRNAAISRLKLDRSGTKRDGEDAASLYVDDAETSAASHNSGDVRTRET